MYHGSPHKFETLRTPDQTGNIRKSEEDRSHHRDVIFITTSLVRALEYAGPEGYLYIVDAPDAVMYNQTGKKSPVINEEIFIAKTVVINQRLRLLPRKRNQEQIFALDN